MREALSESLVSLAVLLNWSVFSPERYQFSFEIGSLAERKTQWKLEF